MPEIGEIKRGNEIGKTRTTRWTWYIWIACIDCGKERWVALKSKSNSTPIFTRCFLCGNRTPEKKKKCAINKGLKGANSPAWKGGYHIDDNGYVLVYLPPDDFFYPMARKDGYVLEHRLVMAKHLNRCLLVWEIIHHKGTKYPLSSIENRSDNRLENLELVRGNERHNTRIDKMIKGLLQENLLLKKRIVELENAHQIK